ncbi:50S ribosomal protein L30 [Candidatus Pantoea edessiphila]|uniref:Large ribosomal subunit protein uL30 n=1 Tax=Candidatus Pantoea edessiphila TaxID=2044610 RepID=A0A2P5SY10_9GAMM|nr:50S ribosomal protein L30 [Candidatus Pantoea edessiphila]MBK4775916.1 50S ribosomal protein L30 [Pantoea sp. Edef]PPI87192.1 50S ribosomal protein L30 [Candidatus Pantoea edessiphila]
MTKIIKITQIRSSIGRLPRHRNTLISLGLRHIGHTVTRKDNPSIRGMIHTISYMVKVND